MNKIILGVLSLVLIIILWIWIYFFITKNSNNLIIQEEITSVVDHDAETKEMMLNEEIKLKLDFLNKALRPNYLKISDFKKTKNLWDFIDDDPNVEFYKISIDYEINDDTLADFDVLINKWSVTHEDFKSKWELYKQNIERIMRNTYYTAYWFDRLVLTWIIWYIEYTWNNVYYMYEIWDYLKNRFWDKNLNVDTLVKIELLKDYFNYSEIFFEKDPQEFLDILNNVEKELNNEKFTKFSKILKILFFKDLL